MGTKWWVADDAYLFETATEEKPEAVIKEYSQEAAEGSRQEAYRTTLDPSALAQKMLDWRTKRLQLDQLEFQIKQSVLRMEKTQVVGNVRATYTKGRKTYDYEGRCSNLSLGDERSAEQVEVVIARHTVPKTNWNKVCKELELKAVPYTQSKPSVSLKLEAAE